MTSDRKLKTLTVAALIELLQGEDPDAKVIFSTCYGDYHKTQQALPLRGQTEEVCVEKSAYSNSGFAVTTTEPDYDEEDGAEQEYDKFLVIR